MLVVVRLGPATNNELFNLFHIKVAEGQLGTATLSGRLSAPARPYIPTYVDMAGCREDRTQLINSSIKPNQSCCVVSCSSFGRPEKIDLLNREEARVDLFYISSLAIYSILEVYQN